MRKTFILIFVAFVLLGVNSDKADAFNVFDLFQRQIGELAQNLFNWNPFRTIHKELEQIENEVDLMDPNSENRTVPRRFYKYGCNCYNLSCSCCSHVEVNKINLNDTACLNMTYLPEDYGIELTFDINDKVLYNSTFSIRNPPPLCVGVPQLKEDASICIKFYKLDARNKSLSGCVDLIAKLAHIEVARVKMGCFHLAKRSRYFEQRVFSYYMKNDNNWTHTYDNFRKEINRFDMFGKYAYNNLLNKFKEKMEVPKISFSFAPNSLIGNIYGSVFSSTNSPIGSGRQSQEFAEKDTAEPNVMP